MYTFSSKLKTFSFILMILGLVGIGIGFMAAPKTIEDVEKIAKADGRYSKAEKHNVNIIKKAFGVS